MELNAQMSPNSVLSPFPSGDSSLNSSPTLINRARRPEESSTLAGTAADSRQSEQGSTKGSESTTPRHRNSISRNVIEGLQLDKLSEKMSKLPKMELPDIRLPATSMEVHFAPLSIPLQRRTQTAVVAFWSVLLFLSVITFLLLCSIPLLWPLMIPYTIFMYTDAAPANGGRPSQSIRKSRLFKMFAGYYPVSLIKEADLPPDKPYVFGYHPHGIIGTGAFVNFGTEATGFSEKFPGITPHLLTLTSNFKIPFYRDILMSLGVSSVSKRSCTNVLGKGPGNSITIVVGGAAESLAAHPGTNDLTLKKRLGFIKMAVRAGAGLVPVFSFGENDVYEQLANSRGTTVYKIQKQFQKWFGFTLPLFHGRGLFNYNLGLMPFRHPIVSVVGQPIIVKQNPNPTNEELEAYQKQYIDELMRIWERYKDVYARNRTRELRVVE